MNVGALMFKRKDPQQKITKNFKGGYLKTNSTKENFWKFKLDFKNSFLTLSGTNIYYTLLNLEITLHSLSSYKEIAVIKRAACSIKPFPLLRIMAV